MEKDTVCKYCNEKFKQIDAPLFANHVRWCKKNPNDTISNIGSGVNFAINNKLGEYKDFSVSCFRCSVKFIVREREKLFPKKSKYFCTRSCANTRIHTEETKEKMKKSNSSSSKLLWQNPEYVAKMDLGRRRYFTSKTEVFIREHFINKFSNDDWTFGGSIRHNNLTMSRDLFSKKLKICFEYDGVWHFKNIRNQLEHKQAKDKALEDWCAENGWRLIRMSESFHKDNIDNFIDIIENAVYDKHDHLIKLGKEYYI